MGEETNSKSPVSGDSVIIEQRERDQLHAVLYIVEFVSHVVNVRENQSSGSANERGGELIIDTGNGAAGGNFEIHLGRVLIGLGIGADSHRQNGCAAVLRPAGLA